MLQPQQRSSSQIYREIYCMELSLIKTVNQTEETLVFRGVCLQVRVIKSHTAVPIQ